MEEKIIKQLGSGLYFNDLEILQKAIDKRGELPRGYFERDENYCSETWGGQWRSKEELKRIRCRIVEGIIYVINSQNRLPYDQKMPADHYARYFHALAILKVEKREIHKTKNDYMRNAFIELWELDDGSEKMWRKIDAVSWFISEAIKGMKGEYVSETIYPED